MNDLAIRGGLVVDGTGAPARRADIGIADGRITEIGEVSGARRTFDADGQHQVDEAEAMARRVLDGEADAVFGSRFLDSRSRPGLLKRVVLKGAVVHSNLTSGLHLTDAHNGLRALSRTVCEGIDLTQNRMAHASQLVEQVGPGPLGALAHDDVLEGGHLRAVDGGDGGVARGAHDHGPGTDGGHQLPVPPAAVVVVVEAPVSDGGAGMGWNDWAMIFWAMGAATRPPVVSAAPLWFSTMTATAMLGACPGWAAQAMIRAGRPVDQAALADPASNLQKLARG